MDISKLELFFAAANNESFTKAAKECNVAQTTMSKYIAQLEYELGVKLFYRTTRECFLTEAGHTFYNGAKELKRDYDSVQRQVLNVNDNQLTIGINGEFFDLSILSRFRAAHPEIDLKVEFSTKDNLTEQLQRRKIHAILILDILIPDISKDPSLKCIDITSGEASLFFSREAIKKYGSMEKAICKLPYVTKADETDYHDYCRNVLKAHFGVTFKDVTVVASRSRQELLVNLSQGFAIMMNSEVAGDDNLVSYSLAGCFNETLQLLYSLKHVPNSLKTFIDYIKLKPSTNE